MDTSSIRNLINSIRRERSNLAPEALKGQIAKVRAAVSHLSLYDAKGAKPLNKEVQQLEFDDAFPSSLDIVPFARQMGKIVSLFEKTRQMSKLKEALNETQIGELGRFGITGGEEA